MPDDLFTFADKYPQLPGSKIGGASAEAAQKMSRVSVRIDDQVLAFLREHGPECPDTIAKLMSLDILTVRPALSRLKAQGRVVKIELDEAEGVSRRGNRAHFYRVGGAK